LGQIVNASPQKVGPIARDVSNGVAVGLARPEARRRRVRAQESGNGISHLDQRHEVPMSSKSKIVNAFAQASEQLLALPLKEVRR
jgi:hypothetical protein